jgi:hypothetical protein
MLALGNAAAEFEVLSPPELLEHLRDRANLFGRTLERDRLSQGGPPELH